MDLTGEHREYLTNKHRGGVSNQKGNTFEDLYATKEIIRVFSSGLDLSNTTFSKQMEDVFVDDLGIVYPDGLIVYHQCKDTRNLTWNTSGKGEPFYDFCWQRTYSSANGENFRLKIVYSNPDCHLHSAPVPDKIADVTETELFLAYSNVNELLLGSEEFRSSIQAVLFEGNEGHTLDKLSTFAEIVRSMWMELSSPDQPIPLSDIKERIIEKYSREVNFRDLPNVELPLDLVEIFNRFNGFSYVVNGKNILWSYKGISNQIAYTDSYGEKIIRTDPKNITDLLTLIIEMI